jgi:hypothetical protein
MKGGLRIYYPAGRVDAVKSHLWGGVVRWLHSLFASVVIVSTTPLIAGLATAYQNDTHFYLENDVLKIAVLRSTGNLDGIIHKHSGVNLQSNNANAYQGIWNIFFNAAGGTGVFVSNGNTVSFNGSTSRNFNSATLNLVWTGIRVNGLNLPKASVHSQISVRADSQFSYWTIAATGLGTNSVNYITFPYIAGIGKLGASADDDQLLLPQNKGTIFHNPTANLAVPTGTAYPSAYASMQLLAYFDESSGFYFASDDSQGNTKDFWWGKSGSPAGDFTINIQGFPSGLPTDTVSLPYNMIVGVTQGDWYAAADLYRTWAVQQPWTQRSRTKPIPAWLHDTALARTGWGYGYAGKPDRPYAEFVVDVQQSQKTFGTPLLAQLDGWEKYGNAVEGDYFPPQEGWSGFDSMRETLSPSRLWVIPSALFLDNITDLYKSGNMKPSEMLDQRGDERTNPSAGDDKGRWVFMDFSTDPWRQYVVSTYATLAAHGVDLLQFDSSMVFGPQPCYNPAHQHPPGMGGNWQTLAWIDISQSVASAALAAKPDVALSAESPAEVYLPYFSLYYAGAPIDEFEVDFPDPNQEPVPLFQYVYHNSILFADFFSAPILDDSYFTLAIARDLTWGQFPNYQMDPYQNPLEPEADAYLESEITARTTYAKKFLVDGIMLPALQISSPTTPVTWYRDATGTATTTRQFPSIQESAWRASDGSVGIILTNIAPNSVTFSLLIDYTRLKLPAGAPYTVQTTDGLSTAALDSNMVKDSNYTITVKSQQVLLVLLTPKTPQPQISAAGVVLHHYSRSGRALLDIHGTNFASSPLSASVSAGVLPFILGTTQVLINGIPAPLLSADPLHIAAQIPGSVLAGTASVVVLNAGSASAAASVNVP